MSGDHKSGVHHEAAWRLPGRGARLIIDLDIIEANVKAICANVTPGARVLAVVKADGYGHGGVRSAKAAIAAGVTWLGVATIAEGIELRDARIRAPILVLSPTMSTEAPLARLHSLDITVGSIDQLFAFTLGQVGEKDSGPLCVHLKINTGMNRFGVDPEDVERAFTALAESPWLELRGVCTHFARSDEADPGPTHQQAIVFQECLEDLEAAGTGPILAHASNSGATLRFREYDFDMVRPGICLYGVRPSSVVSLFDGMRPALQLEAALQRVEALRPGDAVGYGGTYNAQGPVKVGLLPFGYGDGYLRALSNRSWVGFGGTKLPVVGRVSMDQAVVALPNGCKAEVGSVVRVIGNGDWGEPRVEDLADLAMTIPYELLTGLGLRLPRCYVRGQTVVACDNL